MTDLKLDFCNIEDADIVNLVAMLKEAKYHNQSVTHLNLSSNKIGDAGIQALVIAVAGDVLPGLKTLHLQGNEFTQVGSNMQKLLFFSNMFGLDMRRYLIIEDAYRRCTAAP